MLYIGMGAQLFVPRDFVRKCKNAKVPAGSSRNDVTLITQWSNVIVLSQE
jgi:hypothetical protein